VCGPWLSRRFGLALNTQKHPKFKLLKQKKQCETHHITIVVNVALDGHCSGAYRSRATGVNFELSVSVREPAKQLHITPLTKGVAMKGFIFFKNYPTKTEFNIETQNFEERHFQQDDFVHSEQPPQIDTQAPLALTYLMFGLKQPTKRRVKY
jgi:hypothetical protein